MPFARPTFIELISRIRNDFQTLVAGAQPYIRGTFEYVASDLQAKLSNTQHGHLDWSHRQLFPWSADDYHFWALFRDRGLTRKAATFTELQVEFTTTGAATITAGTILNGPGGVGEYTVDDDVVASGAGTWTGYVTAGAEFSGTAYNLDITELLTLVSGIANVEDEAEVIGVILDATDRETREEAYVRLISTSQNPVSNGGDGDYEIWAEAVSGVTRAWEYPAADGPGTVAVAFVMDNATPIVDESPYTKTAEVLAYINTQVVHGPTVTDRVLTEYTVDLTISISPDPSVNAAMKSAIEASLQEWFEVKSNTFPGCTIQSSQISAVISDNATETAHTIDSPSFPLTVGETEIPVLGTVTWAAL